MLKGDRLWLRPLEERDMPAYVAGINDTDVGGPAGYRWPMSLDQARAWLERQQDSVRRGDAFFSLSASWATIDSSAPPGSRR